MDYLASVVWQSASQQPGVLGLGEPADGDRSDERVGAVAMILTEQARYFAAGLNESARHACITSPLATLLLELAAECDRLREALDAANTRADYWTEQAAELNAEAELLKKPTVVGQEASSRECELQAEVEQLRIELTATRRRGDAWKRAALGGYRLEEVT